MPPREHIVRVVKEMGGKAEKDYRVAAHLLAANDAMTYDAVCFHAQQCVEKYLKASLVDHSLLVPKTHDLERLVGLLADPLTLNLRLERKLWNCREPIQNS